MATTNFINGTVIEADWMNDVDAHVYNSERTFVEAGAVGDGSTDDTVAIQYAISNYGGSIINGGGRTYKCTAPITGILANTRIHNATFDFSSMPSQTGQDKCFTGTGTLGTPVSLTANLAIETAVVTVGSTASFSVDGLVWLASSALWDSLTSTVYGHYARVKSIDSSTQITLYDKVLLPFNTASSATITSVTPLKGVSFSNIKIIGAQANLQAGIWMEYCEDLTISNCRFQSIDYMAVALYRCYMTEITGCRARFARATDLAYGYGVLGGCYATNITNSWGEDCKHTVTIGDNDGLNCYTSVIGCKAIASKDAGFDSHPASMHTLFMGNHVEMSNAQFGSTNHDGITFQGANFICVNNTVMNCMGQGVLCQPAFSASVNSSILISNNYFQLAPTGVSGSQAGVYTQIGASYGGDQQSVTISNNRVRGAQSNGSGSYTVHVRVEKTSGIINKLSITGNISEEAALTSGVLVRTSASSSSIGQVIINGNHFKASGTRNIYVLAAGGSSTINNVSVNGNIIDGGSSYSMAFEGNTGTISNIVEFGNLVMNAPATIRSVSGVTQYNFDTTKNTPVTITGATSTLNEDSYDIIADRAGTITLTLPDPTKCVGRCLRVKTIQAQTVVSASSNVYPIDSSIAGTAILPATAGAWAELKSNGTVWVIMSKG